MGIGWTPIGPTLPFIYFLNCILLFENMAVDEMILIRDLMLHLSNHSDIELQNRQPDQERYINTNTI